MAGILACIADSPSAGRVVQGAAVCARAWDTSVRFVHFGTLNPEGRRRLERLIVEGAGAPAPLLELQPDPREPISSQVCALAAQDDSELVVIGALKREGAMRAVVGSTARRVARRCPCSVLLISTEGRAPSQWTQFLLGVEDSDDCVQMCQRLLSVARATGPDVEVCFAREYRSLGGVMHAPNAEHDPSDPGALHLIELKELLARLDLDGVRLRAITLPGRPGQEVARHADDAGSDLVVVRGPSAPLGVLDRLLSHPLNLLLDQLPCSALVYRPTAPARKDAAWKD